MSFQLNSRTETVEQCYPDLVLCLKPDAAVAEAIAQMKQRNRGAVLVCEGDILIGVFTERDALAMMAAGTSFEEPLRQHMTADPVVLRPGDTVGKAIGLMSRGGYRRLPIVDERGRP